MLMKTTESATVPVAHRITTKIVTITPEMAEKWLEKNTRNRPIHSDWVLTYAERIRKDRWMVNGETIIFDWNGDVCDGQHRLWASFTYGLTFESLVVYGVDPACFPTINQGGKRSRADVLHIDAKHKGIAPSKNERIIGAAAALAIRYDTGAMASRPTIPADEILDFVRANPDIETWVALCIPGKRSWTTGYAGNVAAVMFLAARRYPGKAREFINAFVTGANLSQGHPVLALRQRLGTEKNLRTEDRVALVAQAWNAFIEGRNLSRMLMYKGENFPKIRGAGTR